MYSFMEDPDLFLDLPEIDYRDRLQQVLGEDAEYLKLYSNSKMPFGAYSDKRENRLQEIPRKGNFGIIPVKRLLIFDFDLHRKGAASVKEQIDFFSEFLDIDFYKSLGVVTQTGGLHVYIKYPWSVDSSLAKSLPRASLRGYSEAFSEISGKKILLDADVRSGLANGYVVGPGSKVHKRELSTESLHENYWIADETVGFKKGYDIPAPIMMTSQAVQKLQEVVEFKNRKKNKRKLERLREKNQLLEVERNLKNDVPDRKNLELLKKKLESLSYSSYHSKRAFVKASLHCCYTSFAIAKVCEDLSINKDSFSNREISFDTLLRDIENFTPEDIYHGPYCGFKDPEKESKIADDLAKISLKNSYKVKNRIISRRNKEFRRKVNPRVLDPEKVILELRKNQRKLTNDSQQVKDAFSIFENVIQPLTNVGAQRLVLSYDFLENNLEMNKSRVSAALRLLRKINLIEVYDRQKTGLSSTYVVPEEWNHRIMTNLLRKTWGSLVIEDTDDVHPSIIYSREDHTFKDALTKKDLWVLNANKSPIQPLNNLNENKNSEDVVFPMIEKGKVDVVEKYLVEEKNLRYQGDRIKKASRKY